MQSEHIDSSCAVWQKASRGIYGRSEWAMFRFDEDDMPPAIICPGVQNEPLVLPKVDAIKLFDEALKQ